jgi:hypothetical protein
MLIHGTYHWLAKVVAFRNDFCRHCDHPRLAIRVRTLDVLHLFFLPLLPLGFWRRWRCAVCGLDPHALVRTRRGFKIAGASILAMFGVIAWTVLAEVEEDRAVLWAMRIGAPILLALTIRSIARHRAEPALDALLLGIAPFAGHVCPLCGGSLLSAPGLHCAQCAAESQPLAAPGLAS